MALAATVWPLRYALGMNTDVETKSSIELLAVLLGGGLERLDGESILSATLLLDALGGLGRLARSTPEEIAAAVRPRAKKRAWPVSRTVAAAFELGRRASTERGVDAPRLASAKDVAEWAQPRLSDLAHEELWLLALDGRSRLRAARQIAKGGLHGASIRPADPLRVALRLDATAFVLVHNHPSGDPTPSKEDRVLTLAVAAAAEIVGVPLVDHVVVATNGFASIPYALDSSTGSA
jgi:DNA repair protein RadC